MHHKENVSSAADILNIKKGGGEMGALISAFNWDDHPLGNLSQWPESLKFNIRLILHSRFPMFLWWSEELYMFHNDAYLPALGNKHPDALGASARVIWEEIWDDIGVIVADILNGGDPFYAESLLLLLERKGFQEETYWTFSYSPAFTDNGDVNGIFCACSEVTSTVLNERRLKLLQDVSETTIQIKELEQACQTTCDTLLNNKEDIPFCLIYLLNGSATEVRLVGSAGEIPKGSDSGILNLLITDTHWELGRVLHTKQVQLIDCSSFNEHITPVNPIKNSMQQAAVVPVMRPGQNQIIGFFIAGISPRLEYNTDYEGFHTLLASQIATSITSVQAIEELVMQQEYLKDIFQQAPVGITIVRGPQHIINLANPGVCEIWGRKAEDVIGKSVLEALPEVADQGIVQLLDNVVNTGEPFIANELPLQLERNGEMETRYLNFIYHPMRDINGFINGVIAVAIDISEQVKYRQSIETLNTELIATNADLDNFVYSASHDLKAPILNIEGLMQILIDHLPEEVLNSDTTERTIELIHKSVDRFKRTVLDLTDVAKMQRLDEDDVSHIKLVDTVSEVLLDFEMVIQESGALIQIDIDPEAEIRFSSKNMRSIIYNLISNSIKYRSPDRKLEINIGVKSLHNSVLLTVQDNGLGIDLAEETKIFSMFKRLHDHVEGSGIGLYIVKRIIENAGGRIKVESEVGIGSTFKIYFKC